MGLRGPSAPATLTKHLQTWRRDGRLLAVRRGVYVRLAASQNASRLSIDPFVLASRLATDATLAYHTALEALGFAALGRYAELVSRPLLTARLGYVLETHARRLLTPSKVLAALEAKRPAGPVYLERRQPGRLVKRWNLIVPPDMPPSER